LLAFWTQLRYAVTSSLVFNHSLIDTSTPTRSETPFQLPINWPVKPSYYRPTLFATC